MSRANKSSCRSLVIMKMILVFMETHRFLMITISILPVPGRMLSDGLAMVLMVVHPLHLQPPSLSICSPAQPTLHFLATTGQRQQPIIHHLTEGLYNQQEHLPFSPEQ